MAGDEMYVLPDDIRILPIRELGQSAGQLLKKQGDDFVITREANTFPTRIIDAESAALLEQFRNPNTMVEAVISYSRTRQRNPEEVLNKALTLLQRLRNADVLVPADGGAIGDAELPKRGTRISGYTVIDTIERGGGSVYHVHDARKREYALKLSSRTGGNPFLYEASVLERLSGLSVPSVQEIGTYEGRQYLVEDWCPGERLLDLLSPGKPIGAGYPDTTSGLGIFERIDIAYRILRAYVMVHQRGVLHGEVHAKNILVGGNGMLRIIDFSHAVYPIDLQTTPKGGQDLTFYEPSYAVRVLSAGSGYPMTFLDEQYAVAALVFYILVGSLYDPEKYSFTGQREDRVNPLPVGLFSPSNVARLLSRALDAVPERRYPSLEEFAREIMGLSGQLR